MRAIVLMVEVEAVSAGGDPNGTVFSGRQLSFFVLFLLLLLKGIHPLLIKLALSFQYIAQVLDNSIIARRRQYHWI